MGRTFIGLLILSGSFLGQAYANTCTDLLILHVDRLASIAWMPPVPQEKWQISYLDPHYREEELSRSAYHSELPDVLKNIPIHYYSNEELAEARVEIKSGKMFRINGDRLQNMNGMEYVMKPNGDILIMPHYSDPARGDYRLRHSSLNNGEPVASAGGISFNENGDVIRIDRFSGHYKPSRLQLKQFVDHLIGLGVDLSGTEINWN
jgi:hypothetical protein